MKNKHKLFLLLSSSAILTGIFGGWQHFRLIEMFMLMGLMSLSLITGMFLGVLIITGRLK